MGRGKYALVTTFAMYRKSAGGCTSGVPFARSVLNSPIAAQCTSPERKVTRMRFTFAKFCNCSMNQLRSFCSQCARQPSVKKNMHKVEAEQTRTLWPRAVQ